MEGHEERVPVARVRRWLLAALAALVVLTALLPSPWSLPSGPGFVPTDERPFRHTVGIALFWACLANAGILLALLALAPRWARAPRRLPPPADLPRAGLVFAGLLLTTTLVGGVARWPIAHGSFWWDEGWSLTRVVRGPVEVSAEHPTRAELEPRHWARTFWYWKKPTNHVLYNVAGRASMDTWRAAQGLGPEAFDEFAFRLPAFLASLLTIAGVGVFGWRLGHPAAGLASAAVVALHPWIIRYSIDARGYAFLIPLTLAGSMALAEALRRGSWRAWGAYGAAQMAMLWTHPFMIYLSVLWTGLALLGIALSDRKSHDRGIQTWRFLVVNTLAAAAFLMVMAPNLAQTFIWDDEANGRPLNARMVEELWVRVSTGLPSRTRSPTDPPETFPSFEQRALQAPWVRWIVFGAWPLLAGFGLVLLLRNRGPPVLGLLGVLLVIPLSMTIVHATGQLYYSRFMTFGVWAFALCLAVGAETASGALVRSRPERRALVVGATLVGLVAFFTWLSFAQLRVVFTRPIAPLRAVGELVSAPAGDAPLSVLRAGYGLGGGMPKIYDPWIRYVHTRDEIAALCERADREGLPLYVFYGQEVFNRHRWPDGFELLDDPERFESVAHLLGVEPRFAYRVLRYRGSGGGEPAAPTAPGSPAR